MILDTVAIAGYVGAAIALLAAAVLAWRGNRRHARLALAAAALLLSSVAAVRWAVSGHPPIFGTHENAIASALALTLSALFLLRGSASERRLAPALTAAFGAATLAYGLFFERAMYPLTISERSLWVDLHVLLAWVAYAQIVVATLVAAASLLGEADDERDADAAQMARLGAGFAAFTAMLAVGAFYSFRLFSEWYRWEIVEALAAASWLGLGLVIHGRLFWSWRGRTFAVATMCLLPLIVLTYWTWSVYAGTYHYFDIPEIRAGGL